MEDRRKKSYELVTVEAEYKRTHGAILFIWARVFHRKRKRERGRNGDTPQCRCLFYLKEN